MNKTSIKPSLKLFLRYIRYILPYWKKELIILALSGILVGLGLVNPFISKLIIDKAFINKDLQVFIVLTLIAGTVFIFNGMISGLKNYLDRQIKIKVNFDLNKKVFRHLEKLDLSYFQDKSTGEHLYRTSYDIDRVSAFLTNTPPQIIITFPKLLLIFFIVSRLNWQMAVFALILAPLLYLPPYYFTRKMRKIWQEVIKNSEGIFRYLNEFFSHIHLVKAFGEERKGVRDYLRRRIANIRLSLRNTKWEVVNTFAGGIVNKVVIGLIGFYGGYQVIKGNMTLGSLTAIMMYIGQLIGLQNSFASLFQSIAMGMVSCERVAEILDIKITSSATKDASYIILRKGNILFNDVNFWYKEGEGVLSNLSFSIDRARGSHIALVGPSGCGKTTILNLMLKLYRPCSGDIFIDEYKIENINADSLHSQIGIALQEAFLWNDTIRNNIKYGNPKATEQDIIDAVRICRVDEFVKYFPSQYKTVIGEGACKISEGQKQKIAIARALIKKPRILLLDEAFSSMDSKSEDEILQNIKNAYKDILLIVVSHRLSTVLSSDLVYLLPGSNNSMIIGQPKELIKTNHVFSSLFASQIQM